MKLPFSGRVLILGCGSVSQCIQPLVLKHFEMDFKKLTIMDFADMRHTIPDTLASGAQYVQDKVTQENLPTLLGKYVGSGDLLIDLAWNIDCIDIVQWCNDHNVIYINTSVELWDPYEGAEDRMPVERTLYVRHLALRKAARERKWNVTAVVEHGANPGLVSHWTKVALRDIS
ncbi:MAG: saccharopine dehydrogenase NADP-binding domain-containing protein, partial [Chloroflexota bacterium]